MDRGRRLETGCATTRGMGVGRRASATGVGGIRVCLCAPARFISSSRWRGVRGRGGRGEGGRDGEGVAREDG